MDIYSILWKVKARCEVAILGLFGMSQYSDICFVSTNAVLGAEYLLRMWDVFQIVSGVSF